MKVTSKARSTSLSRQIQHLYLPEVRSSQEDRAAEKETANIEQSESEPRNLQKRSLVPRPLPVFQCCTLKKRERAWYLVQSDRERYWTGTTAFCSDRLLMDVNNALKHSVMK